VGIKDRTYLTIDRTSNVIDNPAHDYGHEGDETRSRTYLPKEGNQSRGSWNGIKAGRASNYRPILSIGKADALG
jgi:hypothetical protein